VSVDGKQPAMLIVTGTLSVSPDDLPRFIAEMGDLAAVARSRSGNFAYHTAVLDAAQGQVLVAERWRDETALAGHLCDERTTAFLSRWATHLQGGMRVYDAIHERTLEDVGR
jgi:quinol monooxygenase YgiN